MPGGWYAESGLICISFQNYTTLIDRQDAKDQRLTRGAQHLVFFASCLRETLKHSWLFVAFDKFPVRVLSFERGYIHLR